MLCHNQLGRMTRLSVCMAHQNTNEVPRLNYEKCTNLRVILAELSIPKYDNPIETLYIYIHVRT